MKIEEFVKELVEILSTTQCFDCQTEDCGGCENVKDCPYYTEEVTIEKKTNEKKRINERISLTVKLRGNL